MRTRLQELFRMFYPLGRVEERNAGVRRPPDAPDQGLRQPVHVREPE